MDPALVPIIQGLITVGGTLGGTWLGFQLSKGKEERQWRRNRCLDIYAEVLTLADQVLHQCEDPSSPRKHDPEKEKLLWAKQAELMVAARKSELLSSIAVQDSIIELAKWCRQLADASTRQEDFVGVWVKMVVHHDRLADRVMEAARLDLGGPSRPYLNWWWGRDPRSPLKPTSRGPSRPYLNWWWGRDPQVPPKSPSRPLQ
jgi:hypothetical protein